MLGRKSVLMGMLASGFVVNNAASAVAGTVKPIAATQPPYAPRWTARTAYALGQQVISPNNDVVSAKLAHTSSASYATDAAKWTLSSTYALKGEGGGGAAFPHDAPATVLAGAGTVLFDSNFASNTLAAYPLTTHPERITFVNDPILGATRRVINMTVFDGDINPTENPRAQLEAPANLIEGSDVWIGMSMMFPADWPVMPGAPAGTDGWGGWVALTSVFGPPYVGQSGSGLQIEGGEQKIGVGGDGTAGQRTWYLPITRGIWLDWCWHYVLSADKNYGLTEMFTCTDSTTWKQAKFAGGYGLHAAGIHAGVNDGGPNSSRIMLYYSRGVFSSLSMKWAEHKIATTCQSALPASYPSAIKPWEL